MGSFAHEPVKAADLGGDCCADLEERIAELEATTVRKGNKKVSVTLYGQENHSILFWDHGAEKNTYIVDNNYESSRFGFKGSAKTGLGDWLAGYRLEVEPTGANSAKLNQFDDDNANDSAGRSSAFPSCPFAWGSGGPAGETTLLGNFFLAAFSKIFLVKT
jgi:hypothetical protein